MYFCHTYSATVHDQSHFSWLVDVTSEGDARTNTPMTAVVRSTSESCQSEQRTWHTKVTGVSHTNKCYHLCITFIPMRLHNFGLTAATVATRCYYRITTHFISLCFLILFLVSCFKDIIIRRPDRGHMKIGAGSSKQHVSWWDMECSFLVLILK